ncbi:AP-3 complex subunit mu-1 [Thecamonas trahens ATCC 50062]|uniref:AP-3 complex subunit mu-1 n=1 Tax=Thecamonas trahens ATCC 50062 TaxID=461836 RepID=A0A0L0DGH2_THETB|nr:AP-3 complex subunit mu-1 [Thecamonas trahens ATCC 50062]KNC50438.1 AP-3 complex subunit mu-1 [Thecamonas trahens ATCC 50062]|eukprot:XP_013756977.1 AP-3 complex subunit mu-1 [Thecamonas trahens ATCC 50062]
MMDSGVPLTTEPNVLKELIRPPTAMARVMKSMTGASGVATVLPDGTLTNVPWRKAGVKYSNNEMFFDIVEEIDAIIEANGIPATFEISGRIMANSKLSGMPDLNLVFANPRILDDVAFHPCVRYATFESDRIISFIPPDGEFELMTYRVHHQSQLPLYCKPQITFSEGYANVNIMVGSKPLSEDVRVADVSVTIPFPKIISSADLSANHGKVVYDEISKTATWTVGKIPQSKTPTLTGSLVLPVSDSVTIPESNPNVSLSFVLPSYAISNLKVATLTVRNEDYTPFKGVRSVTRAGSFEIRC